MHASCSGRGGAVSVAEGVGRGRGTRNSAPHHLLRFEGVRVVGWRCGEEVEGRASPSGRGVCTHAVGYGVPMQQQLQPWNTGSCDDEVNPQPQLGFRRDLAEVIHTGKHIGSGSFGQVRTGTVRASGEKVAIKTMSKIRGKLSKEQTLEKIRSEVDMLRRVQHCPSVVQIVDTFEDDSSAQLVTELCPRGDLQRYVQDHGALNEHNLQLVAFEMCAFLKTCHDLGIVYADVKPANWCIKDDAPFQGIQNRPCAFIRAVDMGSSCQVSPDTGRLIKRQGTLVYMAPEVFEQNYGVKADMWSLGITLYWLFCHALPYWPSGAGEPPLMRLDLMEQMAKSLTVDFTQEPLKELSPEGQDFISRCLKINEDERMSSTEALAHPWIQAGAADPDSCNVIIKHNTEQALNEKSNATDGHGQGNGNGRGYLASFRYSRPPALQHLSPLSRDLVYSRGLACSFGSTLRGKARVIYAFVTTYVISCLSRSTW